MLSRFQILSAAAVLGAMSGCVNVQSDAKKLPDSMNLPAIKQADEVRSKLEHDSEELSSLGNELDVMTSKVAAQRITVQPASSGATPLVLIESVRSLRQSAKVILDKGPVYLEKIDSYAATLDKAPETFSNAAKLFSSFADEEPYADVKEDYRQVAILFENLAKRTDASNTKFHKHYDRDALLETLKYIRHQERFLDRFEAALYAQNCASVDIDAFLHEIERYTKKFEDLRSQIRTLNATFRSSQQPTTPANATGPTSPGPTPRTPDTASNPTHSAMTGDRGSYFQTAS